MRRGLRGLLIVLGMLWVAASAGALTLWNGESSLELRSFSDPDYGGVLVGGPEDSTLSYWRRGDPYTILGANPSYPLRGFMPRDPALFGRRSFVPYPYPRLAPPSSIRTGGDSRFGRRDFAWYPSPVMPPNFFTPPNRNLYAPLGGFPTLPGMRVLYHPLGRFPGLYGNGVYNGFQPSRFFTTSRPDLLLRRSPADLSWQILRGLVGVLPYPNDSVPSFIGGWDGAVGVEPFDGPDGPDGFDGPDEPGAVFWSLPGLEQVSPLGASLEFRSDRISSEVQESFGEASAVMNIALVPEPGTGALLLAGLCALAARRRRC